MALQIMKLQVVVNTTTTVGPDSAKFFTSPPLILRQAQH